MERPKKEEKKDRLDNYSGQWVALLNDEVVEKGRTLRSLMGKMGKRGIKRKACVFCVPKKRQIHLFL